MGFIKELIGEFGNGKRDNIVFTIDAGNSVTLHFKDSGVNTNVDKYYNLGAEAKKVLITIDQLATITHINNVALQFPMRLGTDVANSFRRGVEWGSITVRSDVDSTTFEVYAS